VFVGVAAGAFGRRHNGTTWTPVFDKEAVSTIGDIASTIDPSVVGGTGERTSASSSGRRSLQVLDGGKTWQNMGLRATRQLGAL